MLRLLADENFDFDVVRCVLRRRQDIDFVRVQDSGIGGADDREVLEWAARAGRIVISHDVRTMTRDAYTLVLEGRPMLGLVEVSQELPIDRVIEDLILFVDCCEPPEIEGPVIYFPL